MTSSSEDMLRLHTRELDMVSQILQRISKDDLEQELHRFVLCREYCTVYVALEEAIFVFFMSS
jgi:hypothetical protein